MMKYNEIKFFLLLLLGGPTFVWAGEHNNKFLSDILKLDISELEAPSVNSEQATHKKKMTNTASKKTLLQPDLTAQIATLKQQNAKLQEGQKGSAEALAKKGRELSELTAQIATLKQQNAKLQKGQKGSAEALAKKGTELSELTAQIATL
ncbi:hypothetical protein QI806_004910, partial [Escherichia coli]|nr:hypothetical protein [Escherichia coli]